MMGKNELLQVVKQTGAEGAGDAPISISFLPHPQDGQGCPICSWVSLVYRASQPQSWQSEV